MFFRLAIFIGLGSVVCTIIYLTPIPEQTFLSCDRPCHHLDWPMICRVKLTLEVFQSLSKSCGDCPHNETSCFSEHCISVDGHKRGILTANRQLPGPSIQVCENDILVIDVVNRLPGKAAAVHWHGQPQIETPCMDGAPLITQCPIPSYTTFQYKFRASAPGTHLWHAHAGADVSNGVFGSLIVRQADIREKHRSLYDVDDPNHVILISQWQHTFAVETAPASEQKKASVLLINGKGRQSDGLQVPLSTFTVTPARRHRFRVANAAGAGACPVAFSIDNHAELLLIALDGQPINPRQVSSITLAKGERADFVLKANKPVGSYMINVHTTKGCGNSINGAAILKYKGTAEENSQNQISSETGKNSVKRVDMTTNPADKCGSLGKLCVTDIQSIHKMSKALSDEKMDFTIYLPINYKMHSSGLVAGDSERIYTVDNRTFTYPSSPLLTQRLDVPAELICSGDNDGDRTRCRRSSIDDATSSICECVHVRRIPLGATVEIILLDQGGIDNLVYHLHGYKFHVVAARKFGSSMSLEEIKDLDKNGILFQRNLDCAPEKDTVIVPKLGAVALRFKADNPGYWLLRDEHAFEWTRGLDVILQVGEPSEMVPPPEDFPKCGSFVGPDYFLI